VSFTLPRHLQDRARTAESAARDRFARGAGSAGFDRASWQDAARTGLFGLALPEALGGEGLGALALTAVLEGMGRGGANRGFLLACGAHVFGGMVPVAMLGSAEQKARWLPALRSGETIAALAATEPGGGSSFNQMETVATTVPGGILLRGHKVLICNALEAGVFVVLARQFPDRGAFGMTTFLVPRETEGLRVDSGPSSGGLAGAAMGELILDGCILPETAILGHPGAGLKVFMTAMSWERTCLLAGFLGAAEHDLAACVEFLGTRGGGGLLRNQAVAHRLARVRVRLETARLMMRRGASSIDAGNDDQTLAAMVKFVVSEALADCAQDIVRLLAGAGWRGVPFDTGAAMIDALGGLFASGTSEVQLDLIARSVQAEAKRR
jgi:alkylation response protein AidB-like acyl-CoA dehydrogenase